MKKVLLVLLICLVCVFSSMSFGAEKYVIKFGYASPALTPQDNFETAYITAFKAYVEKASHNAVKVESYPAGQMGNFQNMIESLMMGTLQMAGIDSAGITGMYKDAQLLSIPGIFASNEEANGVLAGPWGQKFNENIRAKLKIIVLNDFTKGFRHFTNNVRELKTPDDAKGIKFRVMESPVPIRMVQALGATATPIPSAEMYSALQQGVVDGQENPISAIIQDRTYEVQKYMVLDGHTASVQMNLFSEAFYNSLPKNLQKIVLTGADKGRIASQKVIATKEETGLKFLQTKLKIYKPTAEEAAQWHKKVSEPTIDYVRSQVGNDSVDQFLAAVKQYHGGKK